MPPLWHKQTSQCSIKRWYVVFEPYQAETLWWQKPFLCRRVAFGHVHLVKPVTQKHLILYEPNFENCNTDLYSLSMSVEEYIECLSSNHIILECFIEPGNSANITNYIMPTCVSFVKYLLGVNSYAITPYQLFKYLLKNHDVKMVS